MFFFKARSGFYMKYGKMALYAHFYYAYASQAVMWVHMF